MAMAKSITVQEITDLLDKGRTLMKEQSSAKAVDLYISLANMDHGNLIPPDIYFFYKAQYLALVNMGKILSRVDPDVAAALVTPNLMACLKRYEKNEDNPPEARMMAVCNIGMIYKFIYHDFAKAGVRLRKALDIYNRITSKSKDFDLAAYIAADEELQLNTVAHIMHEATTALTMIQDQPLDELQRQNTCYIQVPIHVVTLLNIPGNDAHVQSLLKRLPGNPRFYTTECVQCHRKKGDPALDPKSTTTLKTCAKCLRYAYCSKQCQKDHWKGGHKDACRNLKDYRKGDIVLVIGVDMELATVIWDFQANTDLAGYFLLEVFGEGSRPHTWRVAPVNDDGSRTIDVPAHDITVKIPVEEI
ncbi:hypothetical protein HDU76_012002 [Blyttiomyces sp. JEL0837]|nr:hypothetical protein HDU76_012002 [Blyttiomyces sp. JEL0837]